MRQNIVISVCGINWEEPEYFFSVKAAAKRICVAPSTIYRYLDKKRASGEGYVFNRIVTVENSIEMLEEKFKYLCWK